jgi:Tol biopolymer transport system component
MISRWIVLSGLLVGATACVVDIGGPEKVARIRIVADISRTDTITAGPSNPITIEISDSTGRLRDQVTVNISGTPAGTPEGDFGMYVRNENGEPTGSINLVTDGQASFQVFFGRRAILAPIVISVPDLQLADTLWFTVKPGAPTYVTLRPGDTAVAIGRTYQQSAIVLDRGGNDLNLSSQLTFSSSNPAITISASGQVTGAAYGRAGIDVHYQQLTETAMVSVVPPGQFATILTPNGVPEPSVTLLGTDGSGPTRYLTGVMAAQPVWSPDATRIYYAGTSTGSPQTQRIYSLTISDGKSSPLIADTVSALNGAKLSSPAISRDGAWIYFTIPASYDGHTFTDGEVWRSHPDGTGLTRLVSGPVSGSPFAARLSPTPSPDGTRLAYVEKTSSANDIQILNLATGNTFTIHGLGPDELRWSPTADRLATKGQVGLYVVNADGTGATQLAANISFFTGLDWSPDGQWIVANLWGLPTIVNPATNLQLPLDFRGEGQSWISR